MHILVTDSGLGGLSVCAGIERRLRQTGRVPGVRLTYFNAWPEEGLGYNSIADVPSRVRMFDRALMRMDQLKPDRILIACNTLSVLYPLTDYARTASVPVQGIIDAGVELFYDALTTDPAGCIVLLGTKTTIESGVHRDRLVLMGITPERIASVSCHGLATAIEANPAGQTAAYLVETCAAAACRANPLARPSYAGLCCTHYGYVADEIRAAMERHCSTTVHTLDPGYRLVRDLDLVAATEAVAAAWTGVVVAVMSKVELPNDTRRAIAQRIAPVSEPTAQALLSYLHAPDLF
jgi:glutamate racemase